MSIEDFLKNPPLFPVVYPASVLLGVASPIEDLSPWQDISKIMLSIMNKAGGCGLAAPQVDLPFRAFLMFDSFIINPVILEESDKQVVGGEGCLSLPLQVYYVSRPENIKVSWTNIEGQTITAELQNFNARVFLHENDHLNGVLINKSGKLFMPIV